MNGKNRCNVLKSIRKKIAEENGIAYETTECKYKGDCLGTCPKCESEVKYLEHELNKKRTLGKRVALAGIAASLTLSFAGCTDAIKNKLGLGTELQGDMPDPSYDESTQSDTMGEERPEESKVSEIVDGEIVEVIGEMPEESDYSSPEWTHPAGILAPEPPEITNPYDDIMGDFEVFDLDIKDIAEMNNLPAYEALKNWTRAHIDYAWKDYVDYRKYDMSSFMLEGVAVIEVFFDTNGTVTDVKVWPEVELMGDMPVVDE